jgi:four helix bundle protein
VNDKLKKENIIKNKTMSFSLEIVDLYKFLNRRKEFVISKQVLRSGTSIGALIRESEHAESKLDFIHKLAIAQKEANETGYWLELLYKADLINENMFVNINQDLVEIQKILSSIIITTKNKLRDNS